MKRTSLGLLLAGALGTWLGVHIFRMFIMMVVWNAAEDAPAAKMGAIAGAVWVVGLLAFVAVPLVGGRRPVWRLGLALAALVVLRQAFPNVYASPTFAFAAMIVWLWWLPTFLEALARAGRQGLIAPAVLLGLAGQVALQGALHGLDLFVLRGAWSILGAVLLSLAFVGSLWLAGRGEAVAAVASTTGGWGPVALGPFLFLQLTLLAGVGKVQVLSGWGLPVAVLLIAAGLLAAMAAVTWTPPRWATLVLGAFALAVTLAAPRFHGAFVLALIPLQAALALLLSAAFGPAPVKTPGQPYVAVVVGAALLFGLEFEFWSKYGWYVLWPVAAALVAIPALLPGAAAHRSAGRGQAAVILAAFLAVAGLAAWVPAAPTQQATAPAEGKVRVLQYNIHQGLDYWSIPSLQQIAAQIEHADADLVALEEVNRGWDISGGVDAVAWLRWRLPQYHLVYGQMNGDLWGNVILSKYPVGDWGTLNYHLVHSDFPRGLVWAQVALPDGPLLFVSTHFSAYAGYDDDRVAQASDLLSFWAKRERTIIAGDFNAHPNDTGIQKLQAGGLIDVPGRFGLGETFTYPSRKSNERLDYIFISRDLAPVAAQLVQTTASDHVPVAAVVRVRP
jgi:endonuclease/exonuclease/phosphatase family metal-dependent hydrolase